MSGAFVTMIGGLWRPASAPAQDICEVTTEKSASPTRVRLGDEVEMSLAVAVTCPPALTLPTDIVLVMDRSGSMLRENKIEFARAAAHAFVDMLDPQNTNVGLVTFSGDGGELRVPLSNDFAQHHIAIDQIDAVGDTDIAGGLTTAGQELALEPRQRPTVLLMTDGKQEGVPGDPVAVAEGLRLAGVTIYVVGLGQEYIDEPTLISMAGASERYFLAPTGADLIAMYTAIVGALYPFLPTDVVVTDLMGDRIQYVQGSVNPVAAEIAGGLEWRFDLIPATGLRMTYRVLPLETGTWPTNLSAVADLLNPDGSRQVVPFPEPEVEVVDELPPDVPTPTETPATETPPAETPTLVPSPTVSITLTATITATVTGTATAAVGGTESPTPTPTSSNTPTAATTPSALPTATNSATPATWPLYLPLGLTEACPPIDLRLDVVIVLDASTSMLEQVAPSGRKLDHALDGVRTFLAGLRLGTADRAALITFNDRATVLAPLTGDRLTLLDALDDVEVRQFTRLDLGLVEARNELRGSVPGAIKAVVGLSDGWVNPAPPAAAIDAARLVRAEGAALYMIAYGNEADERLLMSIADPGRYLMVGDPASIRSVYRDLTRLVPCPPEAYWGRR